MNNDLTQQRLKQDADIDTAFIQRVLQDIRISCALPLQIPVQAIEGYIYQAAQWFWEIDNNAVEDRTYVIYNRDINKQHKFNKTIQLPQQILSVHGLFKTGNSYGGTLGDFSVDRIVLQSQTYNYSISGGGVGSAGGLGNEMTSAVAAMYEISTYKTLMDSPLTYDYSKYTNTLTLLGDLGGSDLVVNVFQAISIRNLYNNYWFFRYVVCLVKRGLSTIYGTFDFKLPGGVTINYDAFESQASDEMDKIEEHIKDQYGATYFYTATSN